MDKIQDLISRNGIRVLSLPQTRRTLDYILDCLEEEKYIRTFLSKTRPPRKFVELTEKGREYLKDILPNERVLFDVYNTEDKK